MATARVKDVTERDGLLVTLRLCTPACFIECRGNETSQSSWLTGGESGGGGGHKYVACNCETPPQREREEDTGHLWTFALETSMFTVDTTDPAGPSIR